MAGRPGRAAVTPIDFASTRVETANQFARLNPQYPTALGISIAQPLLRGRAIDQERRQIEIARRAVDLTDAQLAQVVTEQLTLVEEAYWNLVFAARNLDVQAQALAQARAQVTSNERQAQEGTLAPIDVVEAGTQVANFRQNVATAQQVLTAAENRLKSLMLSRRDAELWNRALVPAEVADRPVPSLPLDEALRAAMQRRPELRELETARAQNEIDRRFFADQAKPQVDLVGSYALQGLAGTPLTAAGAPIGNTTDAAILSRLNELSLRAGLIPIAEPPPSSGTAVPDFFQGAYGQSLSNLFARRFPTALVQLQVELPFGNRTAQANVARAEIAAEQIARQRQRLEQVIEVEVRNALQAVQSARERLDAAASAQRNASEQYESERRGFESGLSTVFLVLERQTALVNARPASCSPARISTRRLRYWIGRLGGRWSGTGCRWRRQLPTPNLPLRTRTGSSGACPFRERANLQRRETHVPGEADATSTSLCPDRRRLRRWSSGAGPPRGRQQGGLAGRSPPVRESSAV